MNVHFLQHVVFEGPARILTWARQKGHAVTHTRFFDPDWSLPVPESTGLLIVLGGPMGVSDEAQHPWLSQEKAFIRAAMNAGTRMIGICLGAQLMAECLGAKVYPNAHKEIGWFPLQKTRLPHPVLFDVADGQMVFHWHGDTFDLPEGALHLARSEACEHQAYIWKEQVLGLQFHMEMAPENIDTLLLNAYQQPDGEPYVQIDSAIRAGYAHADPLAPLFDSILTRFTS